MAEVVNRRLEESIPQFEELVQLQIIDPPLLRNIIHTYKSYEYKIRRSRKLRNDFVQYIDYAVKLLGLIRIKALEHGITKKRLSSIENMIRNHVMNIYSKALIHFPNSNFYKGYISFLKSEDLHSKLKKTYREVLTKFPLIVDLYIDFAKYIVKHGKDYEEARTILLRGIRACDNSMLLYHSLFTIELEYTKYKQQQNTEVKNEGEQDPVLNGAIALFTFKSALSHVKEFEDAVTFFDIARKENTTDEMTREIYKEVTDKFYNTLDAITFEAKLKLDGFDYTKPETPLVTIESKEECMKEYLETFGEAIREGKHLKHRDYMDALFNLSSIVREKKISKEFIFDKLYKLHSKRKLNEKDYNRWHDLCDSVVEAKKIIQLGLDYIKNSILLWRKSMIHIEKENDKDGLIDTIKRAFSNITHDVYSDDLRDSYISLLNSTIDISDPKIESWVEDALSKNRVILPHVIESYFNWLNKKRGCERCRLEYKKLLENNIYCWELSKFMISIELSQNKIDKKLVKEYYEVAITRMGGTSIEIWMSFIKFELEHGCPMNVPAIRCRAKTILQPSLFRKFILGYNELDL